MPILDMPLEELKKYKGLNPKPDDFDDFWKRGLKEVSAISPEIKLEKSCFFAKSTICYDMYFKSVKDSLIYAKYLYPKNAKGKMPVILMFHGYTQNSGDFFDKLAYVSQGYIVLAMDCRGQGGKSEDKNTVIGTTYSGHVIRGIDDPNPDNMYYRNVFLDTVQLVKIAKSLPFADKDKIYVTGRSQGGGLAVVCSALCNNDVKKVAPVFPFLSDYKRLYVMDMLKNVYSEIAYYIRNYAWNYEAQNGIWKRLGLIDIHNFADKITANVLWATALMDDVCPPSTQFAAYNNINSKKEMIIYTNHGHEPYLPEINDKISMFFNDES